jgi:TRAP-type C4-dicarboxylate transport system substrate-binding protein
MTRLKLAAIAVTTAAILGGDAGAQNLTMKIATAGAEDGQHEWAMRFGERVALASHGRIAPQVFPASRLGSIPRMIEGVQLGTIECYIGPPEFYVGVDPRFQVLAAPGVFHDGEHVIRTIRDPAVRDPFLAIGEAKNLKGIGLAYLGETGIVFARPVRSLDDFKGRKIRVFASPMQTTAMKVLGAAGVPLPLNEVLPSLRDGQIDGAFAGAAVFLPFGYYTAARYWTVTNGAPMTALMVVGQRWFDALPPDLRAVVLDGAVAAETDIHQWARTFAGRARAAWTGADGEVIQLSDADHAELMRRWSTVAELVLAEKPAIRDMYDLLIRTARARLM